MRLTDKQKRFCEEYVVDFNGSQAAVRAGYSARSSKEHAAYLLTKHNIQAYIKELQRVTSKKLEITRERVAMEYARIAFSDIRTLFDENGRLKSVKDIDEDTAAALSSVQIDELWGSDGERKAQTGETKKVKLWDKKGALDSLCKVFGWNAAERVDLTTQGESLNSKRPAIKLPDGTMLEI